MSSAATKQQRTISRDITRLFWRAMLESKYKLSVALIAHCISFAISSALIPLLIAYAIQSIIARHFDSVTWYSWEIVGSALLFSLLQAIGVWGLNRNGLIGGKYLDRTIFANYLAKDYEFFSTNFVGALGSQIMQLKTAFFRYQLLIVYDIPRVAVTVVASVIILLFHSIPLALITLVCVAASSSFAFLFSRYRLKYRQQVASASSDIAAVVGDALSHGTTVKSFASEEYEKQRLEQKLSVWSTVQLKSWDLFTPANFGRNIFIYLAMAILISVSAHLYQMGTISIAIIALVQFYVIRMLNTVLELGEIIKAYDQLMSDSYQPVSTMLVPATIVDPPEPLPLIGSRHMSVCFQEVGYQYPDSKKNQAAIQNFSIVIKPGEKIGLVGYSGSGKTTLTKLLLRFIDTTHGTILLNDVSIADMKQADLRAAISYVPQEPLLFHRTIKENILYGRPDASSRDIVRAAKLAYADTFITDLPLKYDTIVGERGVKLSGGQRQRIAIARALLKDAPILVLDEATSALDSESEKYIQEALWRLMEDKTALVIAHRLSTVQRMDRIIVMDKGEIVQQGTHNALLKDKTGIYAQLWAHQSGGYLAKAADTK